MPGTHDIAPPPEVFPRINSFEPFLNVSNCSEKFTKVCFLERKNLTGEVLSAFENDYPFKGIDLPANSNARVAVGLGIMVAVFLAMGIVPNVPLTSNIL